LDRARRIVTVMLALATLVGIGACLAQWAGVGTAGPLMVDPREHRLRATHFSQEFNLGFLLSNETGRPVRIVGASESCGPEGCATVNGLPVLVPPDTRLRLRVTFHAGLPGASVKEIPVYTDNPAQPVITLRVRCTVDQEPEALASGRSIMSPSPKSD
jgi:hypothetical protein